MAIYQKRYFEKGTPTHLIKPGDIVLSQEYIDSRIGSIQATYEHGRVNFPMSSEIELYLLEPAILISVHPKSTRKNPRITIHADTQDHLALAISLTHIATDANQKIKA